MGGRAGCGDALVSPAGFDHPTPAGQSAKDTARRGPPAECKMALLEPRAVHPTEAETGQDGIRTTTRSTTAQTCTKGSHIDGRPALDITPRQKEQQTEAHPSPSMQVSDARLDMAQCIRNEIGSETRLVV